MAESVCVISLIRLPSLIAFARSDDPTWDEAPVAVWSCVELNMAIICACCMTLRPLALRLWPHIPHPGRRHDVEDELPAHSGPYPPTVGTRKDRHMTDPLSLEDIDRMPESPPRTWSRDESTDRLERSTEFILLDNKSTGDWNRERSMGAGRIPR